MASDAYTSDKERFTATALCRCKACEAEFTTSADPDTGHVMFDGVREHGRGASEEDHPDGRWDYAIIQRPTPE